MKPKVLFFFQVREHHRRTQRVCFQAALSYAYPIPRTNLAIGVERDRI